VWYIYAAVDRIQQGIQRSPLGAHLPVVRPLCRSHGAWYIYERVCES
jgi:hypothetical protein